MMDAITYTLLGKQPVNPPNPTTMHNFLLNISFHSLEGYELLAGTRAENAHLYYDLVKVAFIGVGHCAQLILNVPLKTASHYFVLHKIISLPARNSDDKFVQYILDFTYFGLDNIQRNYILFTKADLSHCTKGSITVCSADKEIYSTQIVTSESSLFFQTTFYYKLCQRIWLLLQQSDPTATRFCVGDITFRDSNTSLPDVGRMAVGYLAPRNSQGPVYYTKFRGVPSPPMNFRLYRVFWEAHR